MPVFGPGSIRVEDVWAKPPLTLRLRILKDTLLNARRVLGTTRDGKTVRDVVYALDVEVCREGEPQCTTGYHALTLEFIGSTTNNRWDLTIRFMQFYVSTPTEFMFTVFNFGQETDVTIDITFSDSVVTVVVNGKEVLRSDMLKKFEMIRALRGFNRFIATDGTEIPRDGNSLATMVDLIKPIELAPVVNAIIPVAIAIGVIGAVLGILRFIRR